MFSSISRTSSSAVFFGSGFLKTGSSISDGVSSSIFVRFLLFVMSTDGLK